MHHVTVRAASAAVLFAFLAAPALAQQDSARADTARGRSPGLATLPLKPERTVSFTTDEGTWMSLDVSPDGRTIVFDLVGDLYTMPIGGGKATRITDGLAFDGQPRFSPDGRHIVFVSDRNGSENLWLIEPDGKNARALTRGDNVGYASPEWTPDGNYIVASRFGGLGTNDLYLYHRDGGTGIRLTAAPQTPGAAPANPFQQPDPNNYIGAAFGSDPRFIYVAGRRGGFSYNLQLPAWQVYVYDRETGKVYNRTSAYGSGMRPALSPDGKWLVYATRTDTATALRLRDLASGDETILAPRVQRDDQESRFTRDLLPGYSFTPDSRALVIAYEGRFWRIDVPSGRQTQIPFSADVQQQLGPLVKFAYRINDTTFTVQQIRGARPSPDGRRLAFTALDRLWVMDLPKGRPRRLTTNQVGEHSPVWSPDGRYIAYVTWTEKGGDVYRVRTPAQGAPGRGGPERLTRQSAFYEDLTYTPDGTKLVLARGPRQPRIEEEGNFGMELAWLPAAGGALTTITPITFAGQPHFTRRSDRVYVYDIADGLVSMRLDGTDRQPVVRVTGYMPPNAGPQARPQPASEILISPDGDKAVALVNNNVYLVTVPMAGGATPSISVLNPANAAVPVRRITKVGGDFLGWSADGKSFHYSLGQSFFTYNIPLADSLTRDSTMRADSARRAGAGARAAADTAARRVGAAGRDTARRDTARTDTARAGQRPGANVALAPGDSVRVARAETRTDTAARRAAYEPDRVDVLITVPRDRPSGTVALRGARIITMKGDEVIERADVLVRDNRIAAVGARGSVQIPAGTREIDVSGKTILPGYVDVHAHLRPMFGIHKTEVWEYQANLAYGVTTTRDPQTGTTDVLSYGDLVETGEMLGPRIFSTGPGVFSQENIRSLDDARDVLRRYSDFYNTRTIKQYVAGDRKVRQWVIMAAKELGLMPTTEGALDIKMNLTDALDGYPGQEHSYPIAPLYKDVVQLVAQSGITHTPTLLVIYGAPWTENYWYERYDVHADQKLRRFTPHTELDRRALRRPGWFREDQYSFKRHAEQLTKIVAAGGRVGLGSHGQLQGLGAHWELWSIASGGMKPHDALRVATIFGAEAIGLGEEVGSLEAGKLADLQVLDRNPLENIQHTNTIRYVMKNGRLYEGDTLKEIWPRTRALPTPWWNQEPRVIANGSR